MTVSNRGWRGGAAIVGAAFCSALLFAQSDLPIALPLRTMPKPTAEPNWPFGSFTPVDGGLWVDSYQGLVKLQ